MKARYKERGSPMLRQSLFTIPFFLFLVTCLVSACGTRATGPLFQNRDSKALPKATIYLYAQDQIVPVSRQEMYRIKANGVPVVKLVDGGYYAFQVAPGAVKLEVETRRLETIPVRLQVEAGHSYFVRPYYSNARHPSARMELLLLTEDEAINEIISCRLIAKPCTETDPTSSSAPCFYNP
jgi:Protein of unknown function (DUF2846)